MTVERKVSHIWLNVVNLHIRIQTPLQNPTLGVVGRQTRLWSAEAKVWGIVPKAAWHWGGDSSVANDPFVAPGSTPSCVRLPPVRDCAGGDWLIYRFLGTNVDHKTCTGKDMAKVMKSHLVMHALQLTALFVGGAIWLHKQLAYPLWVCGFSWIHISSRR
jgi:hypothetical protein